MKKQNDSRSGHASGSSGDPRGSEDLQELRELWAEFQAHQVEFLRRRDSRKSPRPPGRATLYVLPAERADRVGSVKAIFGFGVGQPEGLLENSEVSWESKDQELTVKVDLTPWMSTEEANAKSRAACVCGFAKEGGWVHVYYRAREGGQECLLKTIPVSSTTSGKIELRLELPHERRIDGIEPTVNNIVLRFETCGKGKGFPIGKRRRAN